LLSAGPFLFVIQFMEQGAVQMRFPCVFIHLCNDRISFSRIFAVRFNK
jgi:hypothetical protein